MTQPTVEEVEAMSDEDRLMMMLQGAWDSERDGYWPTTDAMSEAAAVIRDKNTEITELRRLAAVPSREMPEWGIDGRLERWEKVSNDIGMANWQIAIAGDALATVLRFITGRPQPDEPDDAGSLLRDAAPQHAPAPLSVPSDDAVECPGCGYVITRGKMLATHTMLMDMAKMRAELERLRPDAERLRRALLESIRFIRMNGDGADQELSIVLNEAYGAGISETEVEAALAAADDELAALREPAQGRPGE